MKSYIVSWNEQTTYGWVYRSHTLELERHEVTHAFILNRLQRLNLVDGLVLHALHVEEDALSRDSYSFGG